MVAVAHGGINNALLSVVLGKDEASGLLNVEQDFGCVNVLDHDGERFILRLLNFTSSIGWRLGNCGKGACRVHGRCWLQQNCQLSFIRRQAVMLPRMNQRVATCGQGVGDRGFAATPQRG